MDYTVKGRRTSNVTDWREHGNVLVRFNGDKNAWEVKVNGEMLKPVFAGERAAVRFGSAHDRERKEQLDGTKKLK